MIKTMKKILFTLVALATFAACQHDEIYEPIEFNVLLDEANTYRVGEAVKFNFEGNADYILFFSGEAGHEYRYRERTQVDMEDIEQCEFTLQLNGRSGTPCMSGYVTNTFEGLTAEDEAMDYATISSMLTPEGDLEGWQKLDVQDSEKIGEWMNTVVDVTELSSNLAIALHWNPTSFEKSQRAYWLSANVKVQLKGREPNIITSKVLNFTPFSMADGMDGSRYILTTESNVAGTARYTGNTGNNTNELHLVGSSAYNPENANTLPYCIDAWLMSEPMALNLVSPDEGVSIKTLTATMDSYSHTFTKAGTYTVTFVATSGNYIDISREVKEVTVTIIDPIE